MNHLPEWTPARLAQVRALFERVLDEDPPDVAAFLRVEVPHDDALQREVQTLLAAHRQTGATLETPISSSSLGTTRHTIDQIGRQVGAYRIVREIGAGGMGVVFEAARTEDGFDKRVAIKFLRRGVESELAIRRFRHERQILAHLSHPHIGALLDGGVTEDQQPYFVMELVEGRPVTEWCDARGLTLRGRLLIFLQICRAVQHAHQNLVVHRDLKPGNILVTEDGTVKLLDFGIAKLLHDSDDADRVPVTQGGGRIFTPEYASPEQVRGFPVGVASDVYALGVILFELLTGRRPFSLYGKLIAEIEQIVCVSPPPRPSTVLRNIRQQQGHSPLPLISYREVVGDLDAIVLRALQKSPEARYHSVDDLARDTEAFLDGRPVHARSERRSYRAGKWIRRHRLEASGGILLLSLLGSSIVLSRHEAQRAARQRDRANTITEFFATMLAAPDPGRLGRTVTMREVLDSASLRAAALDHDPVLAAEVREIIGDTYRSLGIADSAASQYRRAMALRTSLHAAEGNRTGLQKKLDALHSLTRMTPTEGEER